MAGGSGGGGGGLILRAGQAVVEAAGAMATAGLHGRGPEFASLQVRREGEKEGSRRRMKLFEQVTVYLDRCSGSRDG